ncbi:MAG: hypothetical protein R2706_18805 [Acidimicrobiales bacterium]
MPLRPGEAMGFLVAGMFTGRTRHHLCWWSNFGALFLSAFTGMFLFGYVKFKGPSAPEV